MCDSYIKGVEDENDENLARKDTVKEKGPEIK